MVENANPNAVVSDYLDGPFTNLIAEDAANLMLLNRCPVCPIVAAATASRAAPIMTSTKPDRPPPARGVGIFPEAIRSSRSRVT
jgi:hypothetical protein